MAIDPVYKGNSLIKWIAKSVFLICLVPIGVSCGALGLNTLNWNREEAKLDRVLTPLIGLKSEEAFRILKESADLRGFKVTQSPEDIYVQSPNTYSFIGCSGWPAAMLIVQNGRVTQAKLASHQHCF